MEEVDRFKESLLGILTCSTRESIVNIINHTGGLLDSPDTPDQIWHRLGLILRSAVELTHFVDKACRLQSLRQGIELNLREDALSPHLATALRKWSPAAVQKDLYTVFDCPSEIVFSADWDVLEEVFGYLIDNAVRYSDEGGDLAISAFQEDRTCMIRFKNGGAGIESGWFDHIFTAFAVHDLSHHHKGQGLSLAITKQLIELHNGIIHVESVPSRFTVFTLKIPMRDCQSPPTPFG
jgi:signal transduction histidine kinase